MLRCWIGCAQREKNIGKLKNFLWGTNWHEKGTDEVAKSRILEFNFHPDGNYLFKVNNRNTRAKSEICSKLIIKTPIRRQWHCPVVLIVKFEQVSHLVLLLLFLTLSR